MRSFLAARGTSCSDRRALPRALVAGKRSSCFEPSLLEAFAPMHRAHAGALAIVALVAVGATSGCGGTPKLASSYARLNGVFSHAQAVARAAAINLRPADVPGTSTRRDASERLTSLYRRYGACGRGTPQQTAASPILVDAHDGFRLVSEVSFSRAAISLGDASALAARGFGCDAGVVRALYRGSAVRVRSIVVSPLTAPVVGLKSSFGLRQTTTVSIKGAEMTAYNDHLGFVSGRTEVVLSVFSSPAAPPAALERRLVSLLYRRAMTAARR